MSLILVAYASKHGATQEIAEAIADELRQADHDIDCIPAGHVRDLEPYQAVVIGSAVYMKRWRPDAGGLLKRQGKALSKLPFWLFSSGPFGENPDPTWSEPPRLIHLAERLGARDHVVFGGRLPLEPSNFMERAMVRDCPPDKRDLRDWNAIRTWASKIGGELAATAREPAESSAS